MMSFPLSKINKFQASSDMSTLDFDIPYTLTFVISGTIEVLATLIIMTAVTWELVIIAIPAIVLIVYIQVSVRGEGA